MLEPFDEEAERDDLLRLEEPRLAALAPFEDVFRRLPLLDDEPLRPELLRLDEPRLDADDERRDDEVLLLLTSPSSISPRHSPEASSSITT